MADTQSPSALRWFFAVEMQRLREQRGLSREQAAQAIRGSVQGIGHIEKGRALPKPLELDKLLELYDQAERSEVFQDLRNRAKRGKDWWLGYSPAIRKYFNLFLGLESSSPHIEGWDAVVLHGLLQTPDYAEGVIRAGYPDLPTADTQDVHQLVELRRARQREVLERDHPPRLWRVIEEAVLRRIVGNRDITRAQLHHLAELAERPTIDIQILPLAAGAHTGTEGSFTVLSAPPELETFPGCVYVETLVEGYYYDNSDYINRYRTVLNRLRVQAISPDDSPTFIRQLAKELSAHEPH